MQAPEEWAEALFLPALFLAAWFYYPYCERGPDLCLWKALLHKSCPGCGLVRGMCSLVHGHIRTAVEFNVLTPVAFMLIAVNSVKTAWELLSLNDSVRRTWRASLHSLIRQIVKGPARKVWSTATSPRLRGRRISSQDP